MPARRIVSITRRPYASVSFWNWRLNQPKKPRVFGGSFFSSSAHIAGVSVSATNPEIVTDTQS